MQKSTGTMWETNNLWSFWKVPKKRLHTGKVNKKNQKPRMNTNRHEVNNSLFASISNKKTGEYYEDN